MVICAVAIVLFICFTVASCKDPGYLKPAHSFLDLLKDVHPCEMCPDCKVLRSSRSRHCAICRRCVERFDHHCPWVNNCVGVGNHNAFLGFIFSLILELALMIASSVISLKAKAFKHSDEWPMQALCMFKVCERTWVRDPIIIANIVFCGMIILPAGTLCLVQTKNYLHNKTTSERLSR